MALGRGQCARVVGADALRRSLRESSLLSHAKGTTELERLVEMFSSQSVVVVDVEPWCDAGVCRLPACVESDATRTGGGDGARVHGGPWGGAAAAVSAAASGLKRGRAATIA